tara:strand:+ start:1179 stop:1313 length:135 start_codon:yes stop_codon:yes gene_type:complete
MINQTKSAIAILAITGLLRVVLIGIPIVGVWLGTSDTTEQIQTK